MAELHCWWRKKVLTVQSRDFTSFRISGDWSKGNWDGPKLSIYLPCTQPICLSIYIRHQYVLPFLYTVSTAISYLFLHIFFATLVEARCTYQHEKSTSSPPRWRYLSGNTRTTSSNNSYNVEDCKNRFCRRISSIFLNFLSRKRLFFAS